MVSSYDSCPRGYEFWYEKRLRPNMGKAALKFGSAVHKGVEAAFVGSERPGLFFLSAWEAIKEQNIKYPKRQDWTKLRDIGLAMFPKLVASIRKRNIKLIAHPEKRLRAVFGDPFNIILQGWLDVIVEMDIPKSDLAYVRPKARKGITGAVVVPDAKTAARSYDPGLVNIDEQLTFYALLAKYDLGLDVDFVAFIVLTKQVDPKVEWHYATRTEEDFKALAAKVVRIKRDIEAGLFPDKSFKTFHCPSFCDFYPVCTRGDEAMDQFHVEPWPKRKSEVK